MLAQAEQLDMFIFFDKGEKKAALQYDEVLLVSLARS